MYLLQISDSNPSHFFTRKYPKHFKDCSDLDLLKKESKQKGPI